MTSPLSKEMLQKVVENSHDGFGFVRKRLRLEHVAPKTTASKII
jgi:hypothetical protein